MSLTQFISDKTTGGNYMNPRTIARLKQHELIENRQLKTGKHVDDIPTRAVKHSNSKDDFRILNNYFFRNRNIYISKHSRFAEYPEHTHQFLEMNYMLNGECDQVVNGKKIHLNKGDLLLIDVGCSHSISRLGEEDILINLLFRDQSININFLSGMRKSNSLVYNFLLNRVSGGGKETPKYLIFRGEHSKDIKTTMEQIIEEYYEKREFSDTILQAYLSILLAKLVRNYHVSAPEGSSSKQKLIVSILKDISKDYQNISLGSLAAKYKYNKNYLSNVIKKETGDSFKDLLTKQRLIQAHTLITSTTLPIDEIIENIGMKNKTHFYKKYKEFYQRMPGDDRN